jgi:hypothetical protein
MLEEVAVRAGCKVLLEVDESILLIVGDPQQILDQQLGSHPISLLEVITLSINYIKYVLQF